MFVERVLVYRIVQCSEHTHKHLTKVGEWCVEEFNGKGQCDSDDGETREWAKTLEFNHEFTQQVTLSAGDHKV